MSMDELNTVVKVSIYFGRNSDAVQGGGGNTSVKVDEGIMYVKASGTTLRTADKDSFLLVDIEETLKILTDPSFSSMDVDKRDRQVAERMEKVAKNGSGRRPSIETFLHALLGKYVVHIHPVYVNALTCMDGGDSLAGGLFNNNINYIWVPYDTPGYPLGVILKKEVDKFKSVNGVKPEIAFLQNHGLIISTEEEERLYSLYEAIISKITDYFGDKKTIVLKTGGTGIPTNRINMLSKVYKSIQSSISIFRPAEASIINSLVQTKNAKYIFTAGALYPDQIVYCGESPLFVEKNPKHERLFLSVKEFLDRFGYLPKVILFEGEGAVFAGNTRAELDAIEEVLKAHLETILLIQKKGTPLFLSSEQSSYIANWESEKYRRKLMANMAKMPYDNRLAEE